METNRIEATVSVAATRVIPAQIDDPSIPWLILDDRALLAFGIRCLWTAADAKQLSHRSFLRNKNCSNSGSSSMVNFAHSGGRLAALVFLGPFCPGRRFHSMWSI